MKNNNKNKFTIVEAKTIAEEILEELKPYCESIEIVGSIRRGKEEISDIDLILVANEFEAGLFQTGVATILDRFEKVKGDLVYGQTRNVIRIHPKGIKIDCYFCESENYGLIKAIRTGSADFNRNILIPAINRSSYRCIDGYLTYESEMVEVREEVDLFRLIGLKYLEPESRSV